MSASQIPKHVLDAADVSAITQLILLERESRDQQSWKTMRECFHDDALIRISWITGNADEFVNGSIDMARRGVLARHRLGPVLVRLGGARAVATLGGAIDIPARVGGIDAQLSSHARFYYKAESRGGRWKLSGFDAAYIRDELVPAIPGQLLRVSPAELTSFRKSYQMLCYVLTQSGYRVNSDLPGDDRPETIRALEAELFSWAGIVRRDH
jgi:SnoaL-like domain